MINFTVEFSKFYDYFFLCVDKSVDFSVVFDSSKKKLEIRTERMKLEIGIERMNLYFSISRIF